MFEMPFKRRMTFSVSLPVVVMGANLVAPIKNNIFMGSYVDASNWMSYTPPEKHGLRGYVKGFSRFLVLSLDFPNSSSLVPKLGYWEPARHNAGALFAAFPWRRMVAMSL